MDNLITTKEPCKQPIQYIIDDEPLMEQNPYDHDGVWLTKLQNTFSINKPEGEI